MGEESDGRKFQFLRNGDAEPSDLDWNKGVESVRQAISEAMSAKNIAFLLGAGCSSMMKGKKELGVPTMAPLAKEFCGETLEARAAGFYADPPVVGAAPTPWRLTKGEIDYLDALGIDLAKDYSRNLERLMEVLFAQRFVLRQSENPDLHPYRAVLDGIIKKVQDFLWTRVTQGAFATEGDTSVRDLYERFYKKLVLRDRSLPRPWVFTTNYDHFSELAMDRLGIPYANGFSGVVERRFNPAIFRYALAEQLDVASRKWTAVDAFVYLCKLHGSVTWTEDDHGLFPIKEVWPPESSNQMLIYPTPAKQNSSLGSPYADLFREFQSRIVREQSVLITAGYAFGDEHLNNIIYQALTIPTFRLVIFAAPDTGGEIAKLRALRDPRIWIIGGDGPAEGTTAHYFDMIVEHFMPQRPSDRIDDAVRKVLSELAPKRDDETKDGEA
ncbi:SIR2 family protein [Rhodoblastus acidophilus]|uniref:SIR2 family protein n=1 Tax=Candidatus Rhodoblastus alkanivorans TaxID=2954117 RepID=A0ABS9Z0S3_9HYPH|nr:SIR2 family protein [Candidatus Rhodoblastus alkanivorans]MCI4678172.1 SIR2 family protein [Candidatus Rhodoblastus alkanivorans]MCI4681222.1 SIR2 family protein [Candidatus Rhodoblastus alkanivorans]MDI4642266.1 SIR2 family protein [Rhodoblastus acidophilus]